jgi:hypothetical protein
MFNEFGWNLPGLGEFAKMNSLGEFSRSVASALQTGVFAWHLHAHSRPVVPVVANFPVVRQLRGSMN